MHLQRDKISKFSHGGTSEQYVRSLTKLLLRPMRLSLKFQENLRACVNCAFLFHMELPSVFRG